MSYRGRFAPSPTGPLHFGSLVAAVGSYLRARSQDGEWLVRMEDLDPPREMAGAADDILRTLEQYGFEWDGPVLYQSSRHEAYHHHIEELRRAGLAYPCYCSRKAITEHQARLGGKPWVYPGICRGKPHRSGNHAIRVNTENSGKIRFHDAIQGENIQPIEQEVGDFVIHRADGLYAYQLAVVIDDAEQGITEIMRGSDLLDSTARQIFLQQRFGFATPDYSHLPVAVNSDGEKLSKQTHAPPLNRKAPIQALWQALAFLGQSPLPELKGSDLESFWKWAVQNWKLEAVPREKGIEFQG
jgi:glutamyl-Q tRNA(Asp) synthetase